MTNGSRIHIEKTLPDGIRINCFGDEPSIVIETMCEVISLAEGFQPDKPSKAQHDRLSQQVQAAARSPKPGAQKPVCFDCGSDASVELVSFKIKETGQTMSRFKCKACNKWVGKAL